jgi:hypothetical protein
MINNIYLQLLAQAIADDDWIHEHGTSGPNYCKWCDKDQDPWIHDGLVPEIHEELCPRKVALGIVEGNDD